LSEKNEATIRVEMMREEPPKAIISEEDNASQKELIDVRSSLFFLLIVKSIKC
jgi:hypothetical protein